MLGGIRSTFIIDSAWIRILYVRDLDTKGAEL